MAEDTSVPQEVVLCGQGLQGSQKPLPIAPPPAHKLPEHELDHRAEWQRCFQNPGPSLTLQRWGSAAWGCSAPWCPAAPGQRSPPRRGLLYRWGPLEPGW